MTMQVFSSNKHSRKIGTTRQKPIQYGICSVFFKAMYSMYLKLQLTFNIFRKNIVETD